jgi:hypothetical protein
MIPSIAIVHVERPQHRAIRLWLPLFLLWIPLLILSPVILLVIVVVALAGQVSPWRALSAFWSLAWNLSGTDVRVATQGERVLVRVL